MYLLQNNNWSASSLLRSLLTIIFIAWLASVLVQYTVQIPAKKPEISTKKPPSNIVIEQFALPQLPKSVSKSTANPQASVASELAKQSLEPAAKMLKGSPQTTPVNKQAEQRIQREQTEQTEQVYQQLSENGVDIQIAWPRRAKERQVALNFMYQCVGVQFAVLDGDTLTKLNHAKFSHTPVNQTAMSGYSDWIRVAQGSLSSKEQNWLQAYALTGSPIRMFPRHIDMRLAHHLANTLKGAPLSNFRASYQVTNQQLQLVDIHINGQQITQSWILSHSKC